jgi:hypothetical protein
VSSKCINALEVTALKMQISKPQICANARVKHKDDRGKRVVTSLEPETVLSPAV